MIRAPPGHWALSGPFVARRSVAVHVRTTLTCDRYADDDRPPRATASRATSARCAEGTVASVPSRMSAPVRALRRTLLPVTAPGAICARPTAAGASAWRDTARRRRAPAVTAPGASLGAVTAESWIAAVATLLSGAAVASAWTSWRRAI